MRPGQVRSPSRESERRNAVEAPRARRRAREEARRRPRPAVGAAALGQRAAGELAPRLRGVLAHGLQRPALHARRRRERVELASPASPGAARRRPRRRPRVTSSTGRPVAAATATMSGACAAPGRSAWAHATSSGTPAPTSRSAVCSRAASALVAAERRPARATSRAKPPRPAAIGSSRSAVGSHGRGTSAWSPRRAGRRRPSARAAAPSVDAARARSTPPSARRRR